MRKVHLDANVARLAERHEVVGVIGDVRQQELTPRVDVVDVEVASGRASLLTAQPASPISRENDEPDVAPLSARRIRPGTSAEIVGMVFAGPPIGGAFVATETATAKGVAFGRSVDLATIGAWPFDRSSDAGVTTLPGAMANCAVAWLKFLRAYCTDMHSGAPLQVVLVACRRAEPFFRTLLHNVFRALKRTSTTRALVRLATDHRAVMAHLRAVNYRAVVGLEFFGALEARFEHG